MVTGRTSTTFGTLYSLIVLVMTSTANRSVTNHQICRPSARVLALKYGAFREALLTFFDFPAEHWDHRDHLRTSNPIESVFATVRHRAVRRRRPPTETIRYLFHRS